MTPPPKELNLRTIAKTKYGWPLRLLNIPKAHTITRGAKKVIVAVIDLGFRMHPQIQPHLWVNPKPTRGDIHGWDFVDNDASLEYPETNALGTAEYYRSHHLFVAGEIAACAPKCRIMILRVATNHKRSWHDAIAYAVEHGAKVLVIPHGYMSQGARDVPVFYQGTDFAYPEDNPGLKRAIDEAYRAGCLIVRGAADNRARRVATATSAVESVLSVGSCNRHAKPADIYASCDYVEVAAPSGDRTTGNDLDKVWSLGAGNRFIPFTGGCMASGFGGGVAALAVSRFPKLSNERIRQILRNTAHGKGWDAFLGHGVLNAWKAVSVKDEDLTQRIRIRAKTGTITKENGRRFLHIDVANRGALDAKQVLVVAYNGNPQKPARPSASMEKPVLLVTKQVGHAIISIPGFEMTRAEIELTEESKPKKLYVQAYTIDVDSDESVDTARVII
jgi:hypothetical protein